MLQKLTKKASHKIENTLRKRQVMVSIIVSVMIISVIIMIFATFLFFNGFHAIDTGYNMRYLNAEYGLGMTDETLQGRMLSDTEAYRMGHNQQRLSFILLIIGSFMFGVALTDMIYLASYERFTKSRDLR